MPRGRPAKSNRTEFGSRVRQLRLQSGLSQQEVAEQLGIGQPSYADWERRNVALTAEQILRLADIFGVNVQELFKLPDAPVTRTGPAGRSKLVFTSLSELPRSRQKELLDIIEALVDASKERAKKAS